MENTYLPGTVRERIADLMKHYKLSQKDLALRIGCSDSLISRFLSGKTDKLDDENIIRIARLFNVSTDFLLGVTDVPDMKNYEISELGLTAQAARNLYTGKVNVQVVNCLLESPRFGELTYILEQYFNDSIATGFAAQNQLFATLCSMVRKSSKSEAADETAKQLTRMKTPVYQADLTTIENQFMQTVKDIKKEIGHNFTAVQAMIKEETEEMFNKLTKGQDIQNVHITPKEISTAVTESVSGMDGVTPQSLEKLEGALTDFMESTLKQESGNEAPEQ